MPEQPNSAILLKLTLPNNSKKSPKAYIKSTTIQHVYPPFSSFFPNKRQHHHQWNSPPLVAYPVRRIHPTYLLEFDDGEMMEVEQPTKVPIRPERPGGLSWNFVICDCL